jgi:hypothetical protein
MPMFPMLRTLRLRAADLRLMRRLEAGFRGRNFDQPLP